MIELEATETGLSHAIRMMLRKWVLFWMGKDVVPRFSAAPELSDLH
ncbi:hypothetical protein [Roseiflexus sp.]